MSFCIGYNHVWYVWLHLVDNVLFWMICPVAPSRHVEQLMRRGSKYDLVFKATSLC